MKKNIFWFFVLVCLVIFSPFAVYASKSNVKIGKTFGEELNNTNFKVIDKKIEVSSSTEEKGVGYYIKLMKKDSSNGNAVSIGKTILLYSDGFLDDLVVVDSPAKDATLVSKFDEPVILCSGNGCVSNIGNEDAPYGGNAIHLRNGDMPLAYGVFLENGPTFNNASYFKFELLSSDVWSGSNMCVKNTKNVYGKEIVSYYNRNDVNFYLENGSSAITNIDDLNIVHSVVDLTTLKNHLTNKKMTIEEYVYNYLFGYKIGNGKNLYNDDSKLFREDDGKGVLSANKVFSTFGIDSNEELLNNYYIVIEPVERIKSNDVLKTWTSSQLSTSTFGSSSFAWSCEWGGTTTTSTSSSPGTGNAGCTKTTTVTQHKTCEPDEKHQYNWDCSESHEIVLAGIWSYAGCAEEKYDKTTILLTDNSEKVSSIIPVEGGNNIEIELSKAVDESGNEVYGSSDDEIIDNEIDNNNDKNENVENNNLFDKLVICLVFVLFLFAVVGGSYIIKKKKNNL